MKFLDSPAAIILILAVVLLFGAKKLPDVSRSVGQSLRIFKAETKGLMTDDEGQSVPRRSRSRSPYPRSRRRSSRRRRPRRRLCRPSQPSQPSQHRQHRQHSQQQTAEAEKTES